MDSRTIRFAQNFALSLQKMQMGQAFADGEKQLVAVKVTGKHDGEQVASGDRLAARLQCFGQPLLMMENQCIDSFMQSDERAPVRR